MLSLVASDKPYSEEGKALQKWRRENGYRTAQALATELGIKRGTLATWESGMQPIPPHHLEKLEGLGFLTKSQQFSVFAPLPWVHMPYIGRVSASAKVDWTDPFASEDIEEVPTRLRDTKGCFACHCASDSMMPLIKEGDLLCFKASDMNTVGKIIMYRSPDNFITIKQLKHDGKNYILHPLNPKYEDEIAEGCQMGYLVGVYAETYSVELQSGLSPKDFPTF